MLKALFHSEFTLGLAQAVIASALALAVTLLARKRNIHLEKDASIALLRGIVQIVAVGSILALLLKAPRWSSVFLLVGMMRGRRIDLCQACEEHSRRREGLHLLDCRRSRPGDRDHDLGRRNRYGHHVTDTSGQHDHRQRDEHQRTCTQSISL